MRHAKRLLAAGVVLLAGACTPTSPASRAPAAPAPAPAARASAEPPVPTGAALAEMERQIVDEMNLAREHPTRYARYIEERLRYYDGKLLRLPGRIPVQTNEGLAAPKEAIRALRAMKPAPALTLSDGMSLGARDHVRDQGPAGRTGHKGSDGSYANDRVDRYGRWIASIAENIAYGPTTARDVVIGLIVDDGVPDRGHRVNIFDRASRVTGVACGPHRTYRMECVIVYAAKYAEGKTEARKVAEGH